MTNKFETVVTAKDQFSKVFKSLDDLASKASGSALSLASSLGKLSGPSTALAGIAAGGAFGLPATITALTARWAEMGTQINRASRNTGVSAEEMQRWAGAAKLFNVSQEAMATTIDRIGAALQAIRYNGGSPEQLGAMSIFGLKVPTKNGVVDQLKFLEELARVMHKISDPYAARHLAEIFGVVDPGMVDLLRKGADGMAELRRQYDALGGPQGKAALKQADEFTAAINRLDAAAGSASNRIAALMAPTLTWLADQSTTAAKGERSAFEGIGGWGLWGIWARMIRAMQDNSGNGVNLPADTGWYLPKPSGSNASPESSTWTGGVPPWKNPKTPADPKWFPEWYRDPQTNDDRLRIMRDELANPANGPGERAAIEREISRIEITLHGLPQGVTATASSASGAAVRVERAMPAR